MAQRFQPKKSLSPKKFIILAEEFDCIAFLPYKTQIQFTLFLRGYILKSFLLMFFCNDVSVIKREAFRLVLPRAYAGGGGFGGSSLPHWSVD